jgi:hypothetical protein
MSLTNKKYSAIHNKTGSDKDLLKDEFDKGHINRIADNPEDDGVLSALVYQIQEMQEELDYLRTEILNNKNKTGITSSQASAITANTAKTSFPGLGTTSTTALAGDTKLISLGSGTTYAFSDLINNRGVFTIRLTATNRGVTKVLDLRLV